MSTSDILKQHRGLSDYHDPSNAPQTTKSDVWLILGDAEVAMGAFLTAGKYFVGIYPRAQETYIEKISYQYA